MKNTSAPASSTRNHHSEQFQGETFDRGPIDANLVACRLFEVRDAAGVVNDFISVLYDDQVQAAETGQDFLDWLSRIVWLYSEWTFRRASALQMNDYGQTNDLEAGCNPQTLRLDQDLSAACALFTRRPALLSPSECRILARTFGVEVRQQLKCSRGSQIRCLNHSPLTVFRSDRRASMWYPIKSIDRLWSMREIRPVYNARGGKETCWRCDEGEGGPNELVGSADYPTVTRTKQ